MASQALSDLKNPYYHKAKLAQQEAKELKARLKSAELALARARFESSNACNQFQETEDLNKKLEAELSALNDRLRQSEAQVVSLNAQLAAQQTTQSQLETNFQASTTASLTQAQAYQQQITQQQTQLSNLEVELRTAKKSLHLTQEKLLKMLSQAQITPDPATLREINEPHTGSKHLLRIAERIPRLEEEKYRLEVDNAKLFQLISTSKELKDFAELAQDSGNLTYVPLEYYERRLRNTPVRGEWLPNSVYKIMQETREMKKIGCEPLNSLLMTLNKAWQEREGRRLQRLAMQFHRKYLKFQKQGGPRVPLAQTEQFLPQLQQEFIEDTKRALSQFTEKLGGKKVLQTAVKKISSDLNEYTLKILDLIFASVN